VVPPPLPLIDMELMPAPEQIVCEDGEAFAAFGPGVTTTVAVMAVPVHPFTEGVMVNVTVTGELVVLVNEPVILPVPLEAIPVTEALLFLVHE
jgi:hypothetical protein